MDEKDIEAAAPATEVYADIPKTSSYDDPSSKLWSVYVSEAAQYDKALVESWKADMDAILIFAGLFSASVTAFIVESYKKLSQDSGDTTVLLLAHISQQLAAASNGSHVEALSPPQTFQPTLSTLRVNAFWFLSLAFGLTCALAATMVQQWARDYLQAIERRPAPHKKARIRAFLYEGIVSFGMTTVVEGIPTLLHAAVFLFFAGLIDFLFPINHVIAYTVLGIVIVCIALYTAITVLPAIHRQCPYRTPLSGVFWRILQILGLLRYITHPLNLESLRDFPHPEGPHPRSNKISRFMRKVCEYYRGFKYHYIEGNMIEGREMLARLDLPSRYERDLRALQWTMGSLTEDSELEPFVEGISELLSRPNGTPKSMQELLLDQDARLLARIAGLLRSCEISKALTGVPRRKRAIACMDALASLFHILDPADSRYYVPLLSCGENLAHALSTLQDDNVSEISSSANSTTAIVIGKLQAVIIAMVQISLDGPNTQDNIGWYTLLMVLKAFKTLNSIHLIFDLIPTITLSVESSSRSSKYYEDFTMILRDAYLPRFLDIYKHPGALASGDRQTRVVACLKAIYATACHFECDSSETRAFESTARSMVALRSDTTPSIAHYASCCTARLAYHVQCDILYAFCDHGVDRVADVKPRFQALSALHILDKLDGAAQPDLQRQLKLLWYTNSGFESTNPDSHNVHHIWSRVDAQLTGYAFQMSDEELQRFAKFQLCTTGGQVISDFKFSRKVVLSQGHLVLLIAFLQSIGTSPLPDNVLEVTLDTIQLITRNLTARFSSCTAQNLLVKLVGTVTKILGADLVRRTSADSPIQTERFGGVTDGPVLPTNSPLFGQSVIPEPRNLITKIIQALFDILGTIADPTCIDGAKEIVQIVIDDSLTPEATREAATIALRKLENMIPFVFPLELLESFEKEPARELGS